MRAAAHTYRLWVVELADQAGPRVHPDRPNLYVGVTIEDPEQKFDRLKRGVRPRHPVQRHGVKLRLDLYGHLPAYDDQTDATAAKKVLAHRLRGDGFVVNGVGYRFRVYVIRLKDAVGPPKVPDKPWVYVGQTSKDVEHRWREHQKGARNGKGRLFSKVVQQHGDGLMPELYQSLPCVHTRAAALQMERKLAADLARQGFSVRGGH
jgi:hypothetical protein